MKKFNLILLLLITSLCYSQTKSPSDDLMNFEQGQLIVKFKDDYRANITYDSKGVGTTQLDLNAVLGIKAELKTSKVMFFEESVKLSVARKEAQDIRLKMSSANGATTNNGSKEPEITTLKNIFKLEFENKDENVFGLIEKIKSNPNVEYVEPNYIYSINDYEIASEITYDDPLYEPNNELGLATPDDPLYSTQSNIVSTNIDDVWTDYNTGDGTQVIAIIDTGVDYTHPDLAANIWINIAEQNGVEGFDDDGNGFIDDIRGWDFINNDNAPLDDNMHGTHVAGIAGAVGNNGLGISGAAWNVKLMPIKVFQSSGRGNSADIAKAVEYATSNGATIQNMSFGSYAESSTLKAALDLAYASSLLVAAAGNNALCIGPGLCPDKRKGIPLYPAAYTYVLGVQDNVLYTNYDQDGSLFSNYGNLLNYELTAPGTGINSTVPNGGYRLLTGTSMATPLVAGAMALYNKEKPSDSKELIFGNLINTSGSSFVDFKAAIEVTPTPLLKFISAENKDDSDSQNGNGFWEPGETIEIFPLIKNYWGPTTDVRVGIEFAEFEDTSKATIVESEIAIGSISAYANLKHLTKSLKIKLADNVANDVDIKFKISVWSGPDKEYLSSNDYIINVTNAIIFKDYITQDLTLTNDRIWIFQNSMVVTKGATLTIEPGTTVRMSENSRIIVDYESSLYANGTSENPITIESDGSGYWRGVMVEDPNNLNEGQYRALSNFNIESYNSFEEVVSDDSINNGTPYWGNVIFNYTTFKEFGTTIQWYGTYFQGPVIYNDCLFTDFHFGWAYMWSGNPYFNRSNFDEGANVTKMFKNHLRSPGSSLGAVLLKDSNITNLNYWGNVNDMIVGYDGLFVIDDRFNHNNYFDPSNFENVNIFGIFNMIDNDQGPLQMEPSYQNNMGSSVQGVGVFLFPNKIWFGTESVDVLRTKFWDYSNSEFYNGKIDYSTRSNGPSENAHGIVWKVEVNGFNTQDDYAKIEPIGVGNHDFKVYFNRQMDTLVKPTVGYGVREPYTQKIISETGAWSSDGKIYTVSHDLNIGVADGINRIRVSGAKDLDNFVIPVEDHRFNMNVQSAGSASTGFAATPGLGEVSLEWTSPSESDLSDILGYNMYRYEAITDTTYTDTLKINKALITDINYKDYDVVRNKKYFYTYKILRTSFDETDYSKIVTTELLVADLGDSNGDSSVNVLDVVNCVDYILGNNPGPFIDYATDVNNDSSINVLDVVGIVDLVLNDTGSANPTGGGFKTSSSNPIEYYSNVPIGKAEFYWEGNDLYVESKFDIGGMQLTFDKKFKYQISEEVSKFEHLNFDQDNKKVFMIYSFNSTSTNNKTKLLTRLDPDAGFDIGDAVVGTTNGLKLQASYKELILPDLEAPEQGDELKLLSISPSPSNGKIKVRYYVPQKMDRMVVRLYNTLGQLIWSGEDLNNNAGYSEESINLNPISKGIYIFTMDAFKSGEIKDRTFKRLIIE